MSMVPSELFDPLVNENFDLIPQGSKYLKPRLSSVFFEANYFAMVWPGFLVLPTAQVE